MNADARKFSITYSSGIYIKDPALLSTLAVFFDEVCLPYPYGFEKEGIWFARNPSVDVSSPNRSPNDICYWSSEWRTLFAANIFRTLPPPIPPGDIFSADKKRLSEKGFVIKDEVFDQIYGKLIDEYEGIRYPLGAKATSDIYRLGVTEDIERLSLALHAAYSRKVGAEFFIEDPTGTGTSRLAGLLVISLFELLFPQLQALRAEQILEVRDYLKDTREGFVDYVFQMVDEVEGRLRGGAAPEEVAARATVERKIVPWYHELHRPLDLKRVGWWANVLATGTKLLTIDAAPWTPKFYGELLEVFFSSVGHAAKAKEEASSNATQAFQYLCRVQSKVADCQGAAQQSR